MDTHVQQLSSREEEEIDSSIKDKGKGKNQNTSSDKPRVILTGKKRQRRLSSGVWVHFEFLDEPDENDGLKEIDEAVYKIRESAKYYRSSLKSETVEAIIFLRDWAFEEANMDPQMEMLCRSVMKLKVGDNDDTLRTLPELEQFDENVSSNIV
uniref:Uncharacterized protein n=1 Tax=Chenopodium quinoa TaxID=63459 RepID=A0A803LJE8_CHEQI